MLNRPDRVSPATVARVAQTIAALGYVRNDAARQLRAGRSRTVGLVVLDVRNPFFTELARGAEDRAAEAGLSVLLGNSDDDPLRESTYLDLFEEQRVHGVLISPLGDVTERLERLRERGIPAVLVDRRGEGTGFSSVAVDDVAGGYLAVRHLLDLGRRRIALLGGPLDIRQVADRFAGARRAVAEVASASLEIIAAPGLTVVDGRHGGEQVVARAAPDRPDAIFAVNDLLAVGVLQALVMVGSLRVPDDIALVGYDDIDFASAAVVPLTSVRQPSQLIGSTAIELLLDQVTDPVAERREIVFQPELVVRASSTK